MVIGNAAGSATVAGGRREEVRNTAGVRLGRAPLLPLLPLLLPLLLPFKWR